MSSIPAPTSAVTTRMRSRSNSSSGSKENDDMEERMQRNDNHSNHTLPPPPDGAMQAEADIEDGGGPAEYHNHHYYQQQHHQQPLLTQDCIQWDESKNVDLRKLASPHFCEPTFSQFETPSETSSTSSARSAASSTHSKRRMSSEKRKPKPLRDQQPQVAQHPDHHHHQQHCQPQPQYPCTDATAPQHAELQSSSSSSTGLSLGGATRTWGVGRGALVVGRKRRRRDIHLLREHPQQEQQEATTHATGATLAAIDEDRVIEASSHCYSRLNDNSCHSASRQQSGTLEKNPSPSENSLANGANDFADLLMEVQTPSSTNSPVGTGGAADATTTGEANPTFDSESSMAAAAATTAAAYRSNFHETTNTTTTTAEESKTAENSMQQQPQSVPFKGTSSTPHVITATSSRVQASTCSSSSSTRDEFGNLELTLEDCEAMESMVFASTQQEQPSSSEPQAAVPTSGTVTTPGDTKSGTKPSHHTPMLHSSLPPRQQQQQQQQTTKLESSLQNSHDDASMNTFSPGKDGQDEENDPFGDFPDLDFDALDKKIEAYTQEKENDCGTGSQTQEAIHSSSMQRDLQYLHKQQRRLHDVPPPGLPIQNPRARDVHGLTFLSWSRYKVLHVDDDTMSLTKTLSVMSWTPEMVKDLNLSKDLHRSDTQSRYHDKQNKRTSGQVDGVIHLRGEWYTTSIAGGEHIHICSLFGRYRTDATALPLLLHTCPPPGSYNDDDLVLIAHPDMLLPPTSISDMMSCDRRAVLKRRLGSTGLSTKAPLLGIIRHELFQETMRKGDFSFTAAASDLNQIVRQKAEDLISCGITSAATEAEVAKVIPQLQRFANEYTNCGRVRGPPRTNLESHTSPEPIQFLANEVVAVEEPMTLPELGLRGDIDMIVKGTLSTARTRNSDHVSSSFVGIELKTHHIQRTNTSHMAQLALYIVMMRARYGSATSRSAAQEGAQDGGVLLYLNGESLNAVHVAPQLNELKTLLASRNRLACAQVKSSRPRGIVLFYEEEFDNTKTPKYRLDRGPPPPPELPALNSNPSVCERCYMQRECTVYAASSNLTQTTSGAGQIEVHTNLLHKFAGHLTHLDLEYFAKWDRLIDLEADFESFLAPEMWLLESQQREEDTSKTISSLVFVADESSFEGNRDEKGNRKALIAFRRDANGSSILNLSIEPGKRVFLSADSTTFGNRQKASQRYVAKPPHMSIVHAYVHETSSTGVVLRASGDDLLRVKNHVQRSLNEPNFRLDVDESSTGLGTLRQNLINLFTGDVKDDEDNEYSRFASRLGSLREQIISLRKPQFLEDRAARMFSPSPRSRSSLLSVPGCDLTDLACEYAELNCDQQMAVQKIMAAQDYCLVQGFPGTGKTSTIAFVVRLLAAHGKRVLITSYTHAAVDNVVLKLMEKGCASLDSCVSPALLRIGPKATSHSGVHGILANSVAAALESDCSDQDVTKPSAEFLKKCVSAARIVGITALSVPRNALLVNENFDVVIVDEAGQITQPAAIGALMAADSFVLVGDHKQLPPLVNSELACEGGYDESMLKRLAETHPGAVAQLTIQYRMHQDICQLSNDLVYSGRLKCANDTVRTRRLKLPNFPFKLSCLQAGNKSWLISAVDPASAVVFLDTDKMKASSTDSGELFEPLERTKGKNNGGSTVNYTEASVVRTVVEGLLACGLDACAIGVMAPFRAQLRILKDCSYIEKRMEDGLEVDTVDRFQGRDKPVIILSLVRSNEKGKVGRLLEDVRRLNVALTRAECKLLLIGSFSTLMRGSDSLKPVLERIRVNRQIIQLPGDALMGLPQIAPSQSS